MEYMTDSELESFERYLRMLDPQTVWWLIKSSRYQCVDHYNYGDFRYDDDHIYFTAVRFPSEPEIRLNIWKTKRIFPNDSVLGFSWEEFKTKYIAKRELEYAKL